MKNQKELLGKYISSFFADNGIEFKIYINEEMSRLKENLNKVKDSDIIKSNNTIVEKLEKVYTVLDETKNRPIDTETVEIILNTQQLLEEIEEHDDQS